MHGKKKTSKYVIAVNLLNGITQTPKKRTRAVLLKCYISNYNFSLS